MVGIPAGLALVAAIAMARSSMPADPGPGPGPTTAEPSALVVELSADGRLTRAGEPFTLERLSASRADGLEIVLRIAADCRGNVVRPVLERLRKAGLDDVRVEEAPR